LGELRSTLTRASRWLRKTGNQRAACPLPQQSGRGAFQRRADKAQTCCSTAAIAASACEAIFELGLIAAAALALNSEGKLLVFHVVQINPLVYQGVTKGTCPLTRPELQTILNLAPWSVILFNIDRCLGGGG
jgi:hypothetical protein